MRTALNVSGLKCPVYCKRKGSPYSITKRRVPELTPVLCSQPAGDVSHKSHKPAGRLPLLLARPAVTPATLKRAATNFAAWWTEARCVNSFYRAMLCIHPRYWHNASRGPSAIAELLVLRRRGCDLNPGPCAPESSTLTTRLPSHPVYGTSVNVRWLSNHSNHIDSMQSNRSKLIDLHWNTQSRPITWL